MEYIDEVRPMSQWDRKPMGKLRQNRKDNVRESIGPEDHEVRVLVDERARLLRQGEKWFDRAEFVGITYAGLADAIQQRLEAVGIALHDGKTETTWTRAVGGSVEEASG